MNRSRREMAEAISTRLETEQGALKAQWLASQPINYFYVDDLLPADWAMEISRRFPNGANMALKSSLRELKYVAAQMNKYDSILEEAIYAFQAPEILKQIQDITGLRSLEPDELLYAGGISLMERGHFLNPHVDNSHDKHRHRYRILNLLYYLSPDWKESHGCNLELWPDGPKGKPITITSKFNRLVVMVTHRGSWHSVSKNVSDFGRRCVSNYYFSEHPIGAEQYFHVTSFRGRPDQPIRDFVLRADIVLRTALRKVFAKGVRENPHFYKK